MPEDANYGYTVCRVNGHSWPIPEDRVIRDMHGTILQIRRYFTCLKCRTEKVAVLEITASRRISRIRRYYRYPTGYAVQTGTVPRDEMRYAMLIEYLNKSGVM